MSKLILQQHCIYESQKKSYTTDGMVSLPARPPTGNGWKGIALLSEHREQPDREDIKNTNASYAVNNHFCCMRHFILLDTVSGLWNKSLMPRIHMTAIITWVTNIALPKICNERGITMTIRWLIIFGTLKTKCCSGKITLISTIWWRILINTFHVTTTNVSS